MAFLYTKHMKKGELTVTVSTTAVHSYNKLIFFFMIKLSRITDEGYNVTVHHLSNCIDKMVNMNDRIVSFINEQTVATLCCVDAGNQPYCFSCFYAFDKNKNLLFFKSSANTHHAPILNQNPTVAGAIQPDKLNRLAIKGLQLNGTVVNAHDPLYVDASDIYYKKFPFALVMPGDLWIVQLDAVKMTDNTLAFGKKINWERQEEMSY
jgi:uncharacterized protein YhbP (UPF0306 family)